MRRFVGPAVSQSPSAGRTPLADVTNTVASTLPRIPLNEEFVDAATVQPINVQEIQKGSIFSTKLDLENKRLVQENKRLTNENKALREVIAHSGYFDVVGTQGLIKRRGQPVKKIGSPISKSLIYIDLIKLLRSGQAVIDIYLSAVIDIYL